MFDVKAQNVERIWRHPFEPEELEEMFLTALVLKVFGKCY